MTKQTKATKCYACDATATGTAKRKRGAVTRTLPACERHSETEQEPKLNPEILAMLGDPDRFDEPKHTADRARNGIRSGVGVMTLDTSGNVKQVATYLAKPGIDARTDELAPHELAAVAALVNHIASTSGAKRSALLASIKRLVDGKAVR
jgi:hypothetical protein